MPRLYDWQKSETLRSSLEIYDWQKKLEQPSTGLREHSERYGAGAKQWAAVAGLLLGNNLAAGAGVVRPLLISAVPAYFALRANDDRFAALQEADELWPEPWTTGAESANI